MGVGTVHAFLKAALTNVPMPLVGAYQVKPLTPIVGEPELHTPTGPEVYIRAKNWKTTNISITGGTKLTVYLCRLIVRWQTTPIQENPDDTSPITAFTAIVDTVLDRLNDLPNQQMYRDPTTLKWSRIGLVGKVNNGEMQGPWLLSPQRMQLVGCILTPEVKELS